MYITFIQLLKETISIYKKRFFVFTGIIYAGSVISDLLSQIIRERIAQIIDIPGLFIQTGQNLIFRQEALIQSLSPYDFLLILPLLGGFFFTFWAFAALYCSFTGMTVKESVKTAFKNLHRYGGMVFLASIITGLGFVPLFLLLLLFLKIIGFSQVVFVATVMSAGLLTKIPLLIILILPVVSVSVLFSNAPFILLLEKKGIIASICLSFNRVKPVFLKTALFLAVLFLALGAVNFGMQKIIFDLKLALIPDLATIRQESMLRVFIYTIPWVLISAFFDLFLYRLYLLIKTGSAGKNGDEENSSKDGVILPPDVKNSNGIFLTILQTVRKLQLYCLSLSKAYIQGNPSTRAARSGSIILLPELVKGITAKTTKFITKTAQTIIAFRKSLFFTAVLVTILIIGVIITPVVTQAGGGMGGSKGIIGIVLAVVMVVVAIVSCFSGCWGIPFLIASTVGTAITVGTTVIGFVVGGVFITMGTIAAITIAISVASLLYTSAMFLDEMSSCTGSFNPLFGICTHTDTGSQYYYAKVNAKFLSIDISPTPTQEQFAQNPDAKATVKIKWESDGKPGIVQYLRVYDDNAKKFVDTGEYYVSGPTGNICSSGPQENVYSLPWNGKYRTHIWIAFCFQISAKGIIPTCSGCGWDSVAVDTGFNTPYLPLIGVDIKANGQDAIIDGDALIGTPVALTWKTAFATSCQAKDDWDFAGVMPLNGTATVTPVSGNETYSITCDRETATSSPMSQTKEFLSNQDTTTIFDFRSATNTYTAKSFNVAYDWCWQDGGLTECSTASTTVNVGETGLLFSESRADNGMGAPGPNCSGYTGDPYAYDYCLSILDSAWTDNQLFIKWQGLTDRNLNPEMPEHPWLTKFTVAPEGIASASDSVILNAEPIPPPATTTISFGPPVINNFDAVKNPDGTVSLSWDASGAKSCSMKEFTANLRVSDSDGPITATPNDQLRVAWTSSQDFADTTAWCAFDNLPAGQDPLDFSRLSGSRIISYSAVTPPATINLNMTCVNGFSTATSTDPAPSASDTVAINLVAPPPTSTKFIIGDQVRTTATLNVRQSPSSISAILGTYPPGTEGTVAGGPVYANELWWWNINYISSPDGWSIEDSLQRP